MRGEVRDDLKAGSIAANEEEGVSVEKQQEILLINKMAATGKLPPKNQSSFLQKKMQQRKFFDSGDYAMNQNKEKKIHPSVVPHAAAVQQQPVITTPPAAAQPEPTNIQQSNLQHKLKPKSPSDSPSEEQASQALPTLRPPPISCITNAGSIEASGDSDEESHLQIPRPDTVPQRKASILHPSVHSKLSPQPHIHHEYNDESITTAPQ